MLAKALWTTSYDYMVRLSLLYLMMHGSLPSIGKSSWRLWVRRFYPVPHFILRLMVSLNELHKPSGTCCVLFVLHTWKFFSRHLFLLGLCVTAVTLWIFGYDTVLRHCMETLCTMNNWQVSIANRYLNVWDYDIENFILSTMLLERVVREHDWGFDQTNYVYFPMSGMMVILHSRDFVACLSRQ